ncbi:site-specific DNA-methyltransferase [Thermosynechococcus sp. QS41]|uniref:site-specific DNA-methyltransferase n=1 Tax=Thermosynechococcus sp. QS41 TaxID=3074101 RepID=UPI0028F45941|nr:site-specific DNA-methyltransferase [Thermosynechococcus sp. QS41]
MQYTTASTAVLSQPPEFLSTIRHLDKQLHDRFRNRFDIDPTLSRFLVSFQGNKTRPSYRWYKFKEAFSASLVEHLFHKYGINAGRILDPFAGSGTALFAASAMGIDADGIELLPIGREIIAAKQILDAEFTPEDFERLCQWSTLRVWKESQISVPLPELRITQRAYPEKTKKAIEKYIGAYQVENSRVQSILRFALLCVLESISFTRKDGQYLRWDYRSGRTQGKKIFDKGEILEFDQAICEKINEILEDVSPDHQTTLLPAEKLQGQIRLFEGSCLQILPQLLDSTYDAILTSPPYCNRYDYTRTYALELALLGTDEQKLLRVRQEMLSCTVENRPKDLLDINPQWATALAAADEEELLQAILKYLEDQKAQRALNNNGIPRIMKGYFYEMACVIAECARVLKPNALLFMVNDNVRYAGASVSVDMILSDIAEKLGFYVERILVLPNGKGNSSQQMGEYGREALRKGIYIWRKL